MKINRMKADERAPEWRDLVEDPFFWTTILLVLVLMVSAVAAKL
jgi:hypothetical protein